MPTGKTLPFANAVFDAIVSQGVIEHFREGYAAVVDEMTRVIRPGGVIIVSFPALNAVRRLKACCGAYPVCCRCVADGLDFYQFALDPSVVVRDLRARGYSILERTWYEGLLGIADETPGIPGKLLRYLYNERSSRWFAALRRLVDPLCSRWAGYCHQIVARRSVSPLGDPRSA